MDFAAILRNSSIVALMCMLVPVSTIGVAIVYARRPDERRLAFMRPLSLASIFAALCAFTVGVVTILHGIAATQTLSPQSWRNIALGTSETFVPLFVAFGCLTVAWLVVALGMRRATL
jgi:hypothetical protein